MTNPAGFSFISYRRSRIQEVRSLIERLHDLGIPTWQDMRDLDEEPTEDTIRSVLTDPETANAVMWLTPEVADSNMIRRVEAPAILYRHGRGAPFFVVPVAAGGLDYKGAAAVVQGDIGMEDLYRWNILKISSNPAMEQDINRVSSRVLTRRLKALNQYLPTNKKLDLVLNTRSRFHPDQRPALLLDWTHRFNDRLATASTWSERLLPTLHEVSDQIQESAPGRAIQASGLISIPAATALGYYFMMPRRINISWEQHTPSGSTQVWSLRAERKDSGFQATCQAGDVGGDDLAILVSVNADVSQAVADSLESLPSLRAYVHLQHASSAINWELPSAGHAVDLAHRTIDAARDARDQYRVRGKVHLFMAVPVGLSMMIGQLLNTLGQIQTYEHVPDGATGHYVPAALLGE